jgi:hypothetical protein
MCISLDPRRQDLRHTCRESFQWSALVGVAWDRPGRWVFDDGDRLVVASQRDVQQKRQNIARVLDDRTHGLLRHAALLCYGLDGRARVTALEE